MNIDGMTHIARGALLILMLALPAAACAEICESEDIGADIVCLKRLGISIDKFTEQYLHWVSDLKAKLEELNRESGRCSVLRFRYEENQDLSLLSQIRDRCEGPWLEDRLKRFNAIRTQYTQTKARYEKIRELYDTAKELLELIEGRQERLEREYEESRVSGR
jgi:hypothetical protein